MTILSHTFATLILAISGFCLLALLRWPGFERRSWAEKIGLSYLIGWLLLGVEVGLFGRLGIPATFVTLLAGQLGPVALFARRLISPSSRRKFVCPSLKELWRRWSGLRAWQQVLAGLILAKLIYVLSMNLTEIRRTDDAFTWQLSLAKHTYYEESHVGFEMIRSYPYTPGLTLVWFSMVRGEWSEFAVNLCYFNYLAVLLLLFYANLRDQVGVSAALVGTYLLSVPPVLLNHSILTGYADLPLAIFLCFAGTYAFRYARGGCWDDLLVALFFTLGLPLIKLEGMIPFLLFAVYVLAAALVYRRGWLAPQRIWLATGLLVLAGIATVFVLWSIYGEQGPPFLHDRLWYRIRPGNHWDQIQLPLLEHFGYYYNNWMMVGTLSAMILPFLAAVFRRRVETILAVYGLVLLISYLYLFCMGGAYEFLVNGTTVNRSFLQIYPVFIFAATVMCARLTTASIVGDDHLDIVDADFGEDDVTGTTGR